MVLRVKLVRWKWACSGVGLVSMLAACAHDPANSTAATPTVTSGTALERYFPLQNNKVYAYDTEENGERGWLTLRTRRVNAREGELIAASRKAKHYRYGAEQIDGDNYAVVLKTPLDVGTTWTSEGVHRITVSRINLDIKVPAGTYAGCIETTQVTPSSMTPEARTLTVFCPDVGITKLEVQDGHGGYARVQLKSYAAPIE